MDIEKQVATLEQSKRLKELGVEIDTEHRWGLWNGRMQVLCPPEYETLNIPTIKAPTADEVSELLPHIIYSGPAYCLKIAKMYSNYEVTYTTPIYGNNVDFLITKTSKSLTQALAQMLIWLIENKHIK